MLKIKIQQYEFNSINFKNSSTIQDFKNSSTIQDFKKCFTS